MSQKKTPITDLLREIVAYCREAGHDWANLAEAEAAITATQTAQAAQSGPEMVQTIYGLLPANAVGMRMLNDGATKEIAAKSAQVQQAVGELLPPPTLSDDERQWLHYNPNTSDIEQWVYGYAIKYARAALQQLATFEDTLPI